MEKFKVIIVEDVPLELKGTEGIFRNEIPEAEVIGTAENEVAYWKLIKQQLPDLVLLDLGLGGSTTVGVEICRQTKELHPNVKVRGKEWSLTNPFWRKSLVVSNRV